MQIPCRCGPRFSAAVALVELNVFPTLLFKEIVEVDVVPMTWSSLKSPELLDGLVCFVLAVSVECPNHCCHQSCSVQGQVFH